MSDLVAQGASLLWTLCTSIALVLVNVPVALVLCIARSSPAIQDQQQSAAVSGTVSFYEGVVEHERKQPVHHAFRYEVRMAVIDLDDSPPWFAAQAQGHLTADAAREMAGTSGEVALLTHPRSAGYEQNPISVYYCYGTEGELQRCIAEVTNTPWAQRTIFPFDPAGESVKKAIHVSPFQDMTSTWTLKTAAPGTRLALSVRVRHPTMGDFFTATLNARRCSLATSSQRNERSSLSTLWRFGFMPHRVAVWIYWHAFKLWRKGVPFYPLPSGA